MCKSFVLTKKNLQILRFKVNIIQDELSQFKETISDQGFVKKIDSKFK